VQSKSAIKYASPVDVPQARVALIIIGVLGMEAFLVLPSIIIGFINDLGFSDQEVGRIATWQLIGLACGSVASIPLLKRLTWTQVAYVGLALLFLSDGVSAFLSQYEHFLIARFFAGLAGGISVSLASYSLGQTVEKDKNFGLFLTTQVGLAVVGSFIFPFVTDQFGIKGIFGIFCILELGALALIVSRVPDVRWVMAEKGAGNGLPDWILSAVVMIGIIFFFIAIGGVWTYIAPIGIDSGLTTQQTGNAISIGLVGGLLGAYIAAVLYTKWGRLLPMCVAAGLQILGLVPVVWWCFICWIYRNSISVLLRLVSVCTLSVCVASGG